MIVTYGRKEVQNIQAEKVMEKRIVLSDGTVVGRPKRSEYRI